MQKPTNNWITCDSACHGYLATDYSWHISRYNYIPRPNIYAPEKMTITKLGWMGNCGNGIDATGQNGRKYRFCHLSTFDVSEGQTVNEGTKIGVMGDTGVSSGRHLHFVMWVNGQRVDPDPTLNKLIEGSNRVCRVRDDMPTPRVIWSEVLGRDFKKTHTGQYDEAIKQNAGLREWRSWVQKIWESTEARNYRSNKAKWKAYYDDRGKHTALVASLRREIKTQQETIAIQADEIKILQEELEKYNNDEQVTITKDGLWNWFMNLIGKGE